VVTGATTPGKYFILYPLLLFINFLAGVSAVRSTRPSANKTQKSPSSARV